MTTSDPPHYLLEWARRPGPRRVLDAARERLERGRFGPRSELEVTLSSAERADVGLMLTAEWSASTAAIRTAALRKGLAAHGSTLERLLEAVGGPLRDLAGQRRQIRDAAAQERSEALVRMRLQLGGPLPSALEDAVTDVLTRRVLRGGNTRDQADDLTRVLKALPTEGDVGLAVLAASVFGDAHALDRSRALGRAVSRFLALRDAVFRSDTDTGVPGTVLAWADPLGSADAWRGAWASGGVTCDAVSSQVLVLNLPLTGKAPAVIWCRSTPGEPVWLTLRSLAGEFTLARAKVVFVCENPSIVEAAASRLGAACPPLVCTFGRPSSAAWTLLRGLGPSARLRVRADGDPAGWSIVRAILNAFPGAVPWRMPEGTTAFEEELLDDLLSDLSDLSPTVT